MLDKLQRSARKELLGKIQVMKIKAQAFCHIWWNFDHTLILEIANYLRVTKAYPTSLETWNPTLYCLDCAHFS